LTFMITTEFRTMCALSASPRGVEGTDSLLTSKVRGAARPGLQDKVKRAPEKKGQSDEALFSSRIFES
jgi:hypothetical protein